MARAAAIAALPIVAALLAGCAGPPGPIFPDVSPPIVWPPPPDLARVRYVGELAGEKSLGARATGWEALTAVLAGPRTQAEFVRPAAVAIHGERVFVADIGAGLVHLLDLATRQYAPLRGNPSDPLLLPVDVDVTPDGRLLVLDRRRAALDVLDLGGTWRSTQKWPEIAAPVALAHDAAGRTWIADVAAHACFCIQSGQIVARVGENGTGPGQFNFPSAIACASDGGIVVADAMNFRVQVVDAAGPPRAIFGRKGNAAGDFARPRDVAVDADGHIWVLDNQFENIQIFDAAGRLLLAIGEGGAGPGQFSVPSGLTIDGQGRVWIADSYNRRVQVFQYLGGTTETSEAQRHREAEPRNAKRQRAPAASAPRDQPSEPEAQSGNIPVRALRVAAGLDRVPTSPRLISFVSGSLCLCSNPLLEGAK